MTTLRRSEWWPNNSRSASDKELMDLIDSGKEKKIREFLKKMKEKRNGKA